MDLNNKQIERHFQLSAKFIEMGNALISEGKEANDGVIIQSGNLMILLGGLILDSDDIMKFSDVVSMYTAKRFLDDLQNGHGILSSIANSASWEDIVKRIKNIQKGTNGE